jgi:hypothetical protein
MERAREAPSEEEDYQKLQAVLHALSRLIELIGEKDTTMSRLRALLMKPGTEETSKVLEQARLEASAPRGAPPSDAKALMPDSWATHRRRHCCRWSTFVDFDPGGKASQPSRHH